MRVKGASLLPQLVWKHGGSVTEKLFFELLGEVPLEGKAVFAEVPVVVSQDYIAQMQLITGILNKAFKAIVNNYFKDERIRSIYHLDTELEVILQQFVDHSYQVGFFRPDVLFDLKGQPRICEIGARYPLNGWMISHYAGKVYKKAFEQRSDHFSSVEALDSLVSNLSGIFSREAPVTLLHDEEKGTEVFYLKNELLKRGFVFNEARPQDLQLKGGEVFLNNIAVSQFIFEMDREELRKFNPGVLSSIVEKCTYFNDIRTLILIHDKRVLAVLSDARIMLDYLAQEEYNQLQPFLIPSFYLQKAEDAKKFVESSRNFILKLNSGGRGIGAYVKNACDDEVWKAVLNTKWQQYMIQEYIEQHEYQNLHSQAPIHLIGMILCCNDYCYGPGIFRGSDEYVINVHQGRGLIFPAMIA